jgi:putative ABC transport system permease protein
MAASAGVRQAQAAVLHSLYGIGTDVTVTTAEPVPKPGTGHVFSPGSKAQHYELLWPTLGLGVLDTSSVSSVARLHGVASAAGGLILTDTKLDIPPSSQVSTTLTPPVRATVDGVDLGNTGLGPYASARISSGRTFASADAHSNVAIVDATYALANKLRVGSTVTAGGMHFTVIALVQQPQGGGAADIYIPLGPAQRLATFQSLSNLDGHVDVIYVAVSSTTQIASVQQEISSLLPTATVTSSANLASAVTGSLASAASLARDLGDWLAIAALAAAFTVASLLTLAAVTRRVRELGMLKALGWSTRRIVAQLAAESVAVGVIGAALGAGLGFAGSALVRALAPELSATVDENPGTPPPQVTTVNASGTHTGAPAGSIHTIAAHMTAPVTLGATLLAILLAMIGSLVAGSLAGWRATRLRPVEALGHVG